jgi:GTP-binding protein
VRDVAIIFGELIKYGTELAERERWLVLNKLDLLPEEERAVRRDEIVTALDWSGPVFNISALSGEGTKALMQAVIERLEKRQRVETAIGTATLTKVGVNGAQPEDS